MNIFQKKINKQAKLYMKYHNSIWGENTSFKEWRIITKIWNKEDNINSIEQINEDIKKVEKLILEFEGSNLNG